MSDEKKYPSLQEMSGETKSAPRLDLNEIRLDGKTGEYVYISRLSGLQEQPDGKKKFPSRKLGNKIEVIFIRVRRKLRQYRKGEKALTTNEHTSKYDMLTLFGEPTVIKGTNDTLREKFPLLKTNQIVYALFRDEISGVYELVRLTIKGASLGSENKQKDVHDFYSYISSFKKGGADEHFYEHVTCLGVIEESGDLGSYYAMTFNQGQKLVEGEMGVVAENMKKVFDFTNLSDEYYKTKGVEELNKEKEKERAENPDVDTVDYPDDDISPSDIPF